MNAVTGQEVTRIQEYRTRPTPAGQVHILPGGKPIILDLPRLGRHESIVVTSMALSADGKRLAFAGRRNSIGSTLEPGDSSSSWLHAWTWKGNQLVPGKVAESEDGRPLSRLCLSADGALLAALTPANKIRLYDLAGDELAEKTSFSPPSGTVQALAFAPDPRTLAIAGHQRVSLYDLAGVLHEGPRYTPRAAVALGVGVVMMLLAWWLRGRRRPRRSPILLACRRPSRRGVLLAEDPAGPPPRVSLVLAPIGLGVVAACFLLPIRLVAARPAERAALTAHGQVRRVAFSPTGSQAAVLTTDGRLSVWRTEEPEPTHAMKLPFGAREAAFTPDGRHLILRDEQAKYVLRLRPFDDADALLARCEAMLKDRPADVTALLCRGQILLGRGKSEQALADLAAAVRRDPNNALAHYHLGRAYVAREDYDRAKAAFARAVKIDPTLAP
jgi:WD40 repeat protein